MKFAVFLMFSLSLGLSSIANAQEADYPAEGVQSFKQGSDAWRRQDNNKIEVIQSITDSVTPTGIANIMESEQVFCYQVAPKPAGYKGYTIDGMALTGFCGIVEKDLKDMIVTQFLATPENFSSETEKCVIRPKLMLRFVKGVDFTDILLSSPCHSFAIFYAGKVKTYNFKPAAEIIDVMVESFKDKTIAFTSPALLKQLLPIGVAQTEAQKEIVAKQSGPIRNWAETQAPETQTQKKSGGWNNLNF